jgi:threonine/homoserine/homoserine lactone efflux protein
MQELVALLGIVGVLSLGVVSPGPSFIMVARMSVAGSRWHGMAAALGMGLGGMLFSVLALLGMQTALDAVPALFFLLRLGGGLYLSHLGFRIFRNARSPLAFKDAADENPRQFSRAIWRGLATQLSNPKTLVGYASVFAALLPRQYSTSFGIAVPLAMFSVEAIWYTIVAVLLSSQGPRRIYLGCKVWIDRMTGGLLVGLGLRLLLTTLDE